MSIFKACDVRGVVGTDWDAADALRIGRSLGDMLRRRGQVSVCVGGDCRRSTPALKQALTQGLAEAGVDVLDLGQLPTPLVYFVARQRSCANVVVVTASHNAGKYNGVKFLIAGQPAVPKLVEELKAGLGTDGERHVEAGQIPGALVSVDPKDSIAAYERWVIDATRTFVGTAARTVPRCHIGSTRNTTGAVQASWEQGPPTQTTRAAREPLRIVLDAMAGTFTSIAPRVLQAAGYAVTSVSTEIDPDFANRAPNPASDGNLQSVRDLARQVNADLGIALDGDGDRVILVDHASQIVRPEQLAAILIRHCFERPKIVYDLKCASLVPRETALANGTALMRPSGHGFIKATMIQEQAEMGVEVSGHHFFRELAGGDDGLFTALVILELIKTTGQRLADLVAPIGWPAITADLRLPFTGDTAQIIERIASGCQGAVTRLDGVRADYDGGWALARASITESAITFRFEGRDNEQREAIVKQFLSGVPDLYRQVMEMIDE